MCWFALMVIVVALSSSCGDVAATDDTASVTQAVGSPCPPSIGHGDNGPYVFDSNGFSYDYYVYVPPTYDDCQGSYPLVLNFHGAGQTATGFQAKPFMDELRLRANTVGAVLVWIDSGTPSAQWNAGFCCVGQDHVLMVDEFVAFATSMLSIDTDRIHAVGFSNGAMFTQHLAVTLPDIFASVAAMAGASGSFTNTAMPRACWNPYDTACGWTQDMVWSTLPPPSSDVAVFMLRGSNDLVIPVHGLPLIPLQLFIPAVSNPFMPGETDFELWSAATGCSTVAVTTFPGVGDHHLCSGGGGKKVRHDVVFNMGHYMPTSIVGDPSFANYDGPTHVAQFLWNNPK